MRYFVALITLVLSASVVRAQDTAYNAFGVPEAVVKEIEPAAPVATAKPQLAECNNPDFLAQVRQKIDQMQQKSAEENIMSRRARILALKHLGNFQEMDAAFFAPKENYAVANRMIYLKINEGMKDADFGLCVSENPVLARKIYLLMYQTTDGVKVEIINYLNAAQESEPYFVYKK